MSLFDANVQYSSNSYMPTRFISHARLGLQRDIVEHEPNLLEKTGNLALWFVDNLPRKIWHGIKDPRVLTVAFTALALFADTYVFYSEHTKKFMKEVVKFFEKIPLEYVKLGAYIVSVETILGYSFRAQGRFMNKELMEAFYQNKSVEAAKTNRD